jgi:hypothetical protein
MSPKQIPISKKTKHKIKEIFLKIWPPNNWVIATFFLLWGIVIFKNYYSLQRFPIHLSRLDPLFSVLTIGNCLNVFFRYFSSLSWIVYIGILFIAGGIIFLRILKIQGDNYLEQLSFALGIGSGIFSFSIFVLGCFGLWKPSIFRVIIFLCGITLYPAFCIWKQQQRMYFSALPDNKEKTGGVVKFFFSVVVIGSFFLHLLGALTPEIFYDSLVCHLGIPNYYKVSQKILPIPSLSHYAAFPLGIEMLYGLAILISDEILAKLIHWLLGIGVFLTFLGWAKRVRSSLVGWFAAAVYFSMPMLHTNISATAIDVGTTFFQLLACYAFFNGLSEEKKLSRRRWLLLSGIMIGFTMTTKYTAFPLLPIICLCLLYEKKIRQKLLRKETMEELALLIIPALVLILPWLIKNIVFYQNPLYPFLGTKFGQPLLDPVKWAKFCNDAGMRNIGAIIKSGRALKSFLFHPWIMTMEGNANVCFIGPSFLFLLPLLFIVRMTSTRLRIERFVFVSLWLTWLFTTTMLRFFIPSLALLSILLARIIFSSFINQSTRIVIIIFSFITLLGNLFWSAIFFQSAQGWLVVFNRLSKDEYLSSTQKGYPYPIYSAYQWINKNLSPENKILVFPDERGYYCDRPYLVSSVFNRQLLIEWIKKSTDEEMLREYFRLSGVTHLLVNFYEAIRLQDYNNRYQMDEKNWQVLEKFWNKYVKLIWQDVKGSREDPRALFLYTILSQEEADEPHPIPTNYLTRWR